MDENVDDLKSWQPHVSLPADFQSQVWQKIATREEERQSTGLWFRTLTDWFLEPRGVAALASLALLVSFSLGQVQSRHVVEQQRSDWQSRYLASIDPYAHSETRSR